MDTTTSVDGAAPAAQPNADDSAQTTEAVDDGQVVTTDDNGTPTLKPVAPEESAEKADEAPGETPAESQAADKTDAEIAAWSEKKGLKINPDNPNEVKLARMQLEAERKMHQATQVKVQPPQEVPLVGDEAIDEIAARQNIMDLKLYVRDWFDANPDMKEHKVELEALSKKYPDIQNMDHLRAHLLADPNRAEQLKTEGGREALTNLAQKQQAIPPSAGATNSAVYETQTITPQNVFDLVDKNDQAWFEKNHDAISKAMSGK